MAVAVQACTRRKLSSIGVAEIAKSLPFSLCLAAVPLASGCNESAALEYTEPMTLGGREVGPQTLNAGRDLYIRYCVSCHGRAGAGDGPAARSLEFPPRDFRTGQFSFVAEGQLPSHEALLERIETGVPERGMPPWKGMRAEDLSALADYIKTFSPRWSQSPAGSEVPS